MQTILQEYERKEGTLSEIRDLFEDVISLRAALPITNDLAEKGNFLLEAADGMLDV